MLEIIIRACNQAPLALCTGLGYSASVNDFGSTLLEKRRSANGIYDVAIAGRNAAAAASVKRGLFRDLNSFFLP